MLDTLELVRINLFSPMILAFMMGIVTALAKSDLRLPEQIYTAISIYLLFSIGLEGGFDLVDAPLDTFIAPAIVAALIGAIIPVIAYFYLTKIAHLSATDAIATGIHYGGVSSVTLSAGIAFLGDLGVTFEGFLPTLYVIMEMPAFFVALLLVAWRTGKQTQSLGEVARATLRGKTFILLGGGIIIGLLSGEAGKELVTPFFFDLFPGILTLFLLQMGTVVADRIHELRDISPLVMVYAIGAPFLHAFFGILLGTLAGLSIGGVFLLSVIAASGSFISAPAVVRTNLPEANPGIYMTTALVIAFPVNIVFGLPIYYEAAVIMSALLG
ncbi:MAG: sodium-dependent bicarbonate transport family permease [Phototrophicaceae bacterium]